MKRGVNTMAPSGRASTTALIGPGGMRTNWSTTAASNRAGRLPEIARRKQMRRQQVLREDDDLRTDDGGKDAAGEHPGHHFRPVGFARGVGGGEAIGHVRGGVETAAEGAEDQQPEVALHCRAVGNQPGEHAEGRAALQGETPAVMPRQCADRQRAEPHAEHHAGDGQCGETFVRRQHRAENAGRGDDDGIVAAGQRLRHRQHHGIAAREPVIEDVLNGFGDRRHDLAPGPRSFYRRLRRMATASHAGQV